MSLWSVGSGGSDVATYILIPNHTVPQSPGIAGVGMLLGKVAGEVAMYH